MSRQLSDVVDESRPDFAAALGSVRAASERLSGTAASIERIVSGNEGALSQLAGSGGADLQQLLLEVRDTSAEVRALARQLRENPSALLRERPDDGVELPRMRRMIVLLAAAAMCAGCVGSALESKREEPEVFRLTTPETPDAGAALPRALAVGRPRAPVSLDTERIAVAGPGDALRLLLRRPLGGTGAADAAASPGPGARGRWPVRDRGRGAEPGAERVPARDRAATLRG